jgi:alkanesulfonate monooxygenase SsuD/methylene tetrahydromethanopterin reductase-like flavin-dependent oxidoreductase (luciferase family)
VAARTSKIKVGSLVTNVNLRNPALLAKIAATVDNISHGRLILGLGVGDRLSVEELRSYGYRFPPLNERLTLLRETIMLLRDLWTKDTVSYKGELVNVSDTVCRPKPIQNGGPPIWIGGRHTAIIDIVAELADGWNHWGLDKQKQAERETHLDTRCGLVGRDPSRIVESWAGSMPTIYGNSRNLAEAMKSRLKTEVGQRTHYFIASFPTEADHNAYQSFADAVKSLD